MRVHTNRVRPEAIDRPAVVQVSPTVRAIGNILDSLPGTGPRTLLGALALVVGVTFWLQPETPSKQETGFDEAAKVEGRIELPPAEKPKDLTRDTKAEDAARDREYEVSADPVLR